MTSHSSRRQLSTNLWLCESIFTQFRRLPPLCTIRRKTHIPFCPSTHFVLPDFPVRRDNMLSINKVTLLFACKTVVCITLFDLQLDVQNSYLFTYNTFIKILYLFRALPCSSSGGLRRNCIYAASDIVTLCRWLSCAPVKKELQFFLNRCTREWRYQRLHIYTVTT